MNKYLLLFSFVMITHSIPFFGVGTSLSKNEINLIAIEEKSKTVTTHICKHMVSTNPIISKETITKYLLAKQIVQKNIFFIESRKQLNNLPLTFDNHFDGFIGIQETRRNPVRFNPIFVSHLPEGCFKSCLRTGTFILPKNTSRHSQDLLADHFSLPSLIDDSSQPAVTIHGLPPKLLPKSPPSDK